MPQASDKDRERYLSTFPDIGPEHACMELERRGYTLNDDWTWFPPDGRAPTEEELFWVGFLIGEWDFGGIAQVT